MKEVQRRAFLLFGLTASQAVLTACGGGDGGTGTALAAPAPAPLPPTAPPPEPSLPPAPTPVTPPAAAPPSLPPPPAPMPAWDSLSTVMLVNGGTVPAMFDLKTTLPPGIAPGGTFEVDASGAALPAGVQLGADGWLTVTPAALPGSTAGLVFAYIEP